MRECGTAGALVLHPFIFCFSTARVRDRRSTSSTLIYYSFFSTFIYIIILTAGLREQAINVTQSWRGILKLKFDTDQGLIHVEVDLP